MEPVIGFDLRTPPPGSRQLLRSLHAQLRDHILAGRLRPGVRLPSSRALADALQVGRNTAISLYDLLASEGYVVTQAGGGTFVADLSLVHPPRATPRRASGPDPRLAPPWRSRLPVDFIQPVLPHDFSVGLPDEALFPFDIWRRLYARGLRRMGERSRGYQAPMGLEPLRSALCGHLSHSRAVPATPDDVAVCNGAQQAFRLLAQILVVPGKTVVAVEDPGYAPLRWAFEAAGARLAPVPVDSEGMDVSRLPADATVACVTPSHQFPLGMPMTLERRNQLLAWARARNGVIVEDDYDSELRYGPRPLEALKALDTRESVFYVGTLSKSLFPALRMGYAVLPSWARGAFAAARQVADWHTPVAEQLALEAFISEGHLARHLRRARNEYARRHEQLTRAVQRHMGNLVELVPSEAGLHVACRLGPPRKARAAEAQARERGVAVKAFAATGSATSGIMLGFGRARAESIDRGIARLAQVLRAQRE